MMYKLLNKWQLISSEVIDVPVEEVSLPEYEPSSFFDASIPGTVTGHLADAGHYEDPYYGTNMKKMPGFKHGRKEHFAFYHMPADSPFRKAFWYRKNIDIDQIPKNKRFRLKIDGLNYRANLWINGKRAAGDNHLIGAYRRYDIDITNFLNENSENCIAFELYAQKPDELGITFIDWGPVPPDDSMGLWQPVTLYSTEEVSISDFYVKGKPSDKGKGKIEAFAELRNDSDINKDVVLKLKVDTVTIEKEYTLPPKSIVEIDFLPEKYKQLIIDNPRLWWSHDLGDPELYDAKIELYRDNEITDSKEVRFGIREITSHINEHGTRIFELNGKPVLLRGAAWSPDLMLRQSKVQDKIDIAYVKNMGFNTIRFEGKFGSDYLWDLCDQEGVLVLAGWPCCTHWEKWNEWKEGDLDVALECLKSQLKRLRNHPSLIVWFYGSDFPPPVNIEREYLKVLAKYCNNISAISSASAYPSAIQGDTGVKMSGPYGYVPPDYWYKDNMPGKADSFNTEAGPDVTIPKLSSLRRFIPEDELYSGSSSWNFHCGLASFPNTSISDSAIEGRYGKPEDILDHNKKAQVLSYEVWRAAYEAYGDIFPIGGGFIGWMLNSGWPSMIWQLYDFYNKPVGGFWGAKKGCESVHVQYNYVENSLKLCNYGIAQPESVNISALIYNLKGEMLKEITYSENLPDYGSIQLGELPEIKEVTFLFIEWKLDSKENGYNCYWIPFEKDEYQEKNSRKTWFTWPLDKHANLKDLNALDECDVNYSIEMKNEFEVKVRLKNCEEKIAFFIEASTEKDCVIIWNDNCISLKPFEERVIVGTIKEELQKTKLSVDDIKLTSWNCNLKKEE